MDWLIWLLFGERWPSGATLQSTAWSFRAVPPWWLLVLVSLLCLGAVVWLYRREKLSKVTRLTLIGLRVLTFLVLGLLLCRPTLETTLQTQRQRPVVVLIDNSQSMLLRDPRTNISDKWRIALAAGTIPLTQGIPPDASPSQIPERTPESLSRIELARLILAHPELKLLEKLADKGPVQIKLFGKEISSGSLSSKGTAVDLAGLTAGETTSALGDALLALVNIDSEVERPAAVVVVTDGLEQGSQTVPEQAAQRYQQLNIPLHCYGAGSADWAYLNIKSVTLPEVLFLDDTVSAGIAWRAHGLRDGLLNATITLGDVVVARKELRGKDGDHIVESIPFAVPKNLRIDGAVDLIVSLTGPALSGSPLSEVEWTKRVRLVDRKVRVLVVDNAPRFETKFLMAALLRDRRVEAHFHFTGNDPVGMQNQPFLVGLPATRSELFQYDLVFLGDVPADAWGQERLGWLRDLVREGAGLVLIAGKRHNPATYMKTALAEAIPVETATGMPAFDDSLKTEMYKPKLTPFGQRHEMLALADLPEEHLKIWQDLPGFYNAFPVIKPRPGAIVLLQHPERKAGDIGLPIMAQQRFGRGQVFYVGTDEVWRWRANAGDKVHTRFWGQVVYQLGLPRLLGGARRVQFSMERTEQWVGQPSFVYVRAYNNDYQLITDSKLMAQIVPLDRHGKPTGEAPQSLILEAIPGQPGEYRALLSNEKTGRFMLTLDAPEASQMPFHVEFPPNDERIPAPMAAVRLQALAAAAGGAYYREEDLPQLAGNIHGQLGSFSFRRDAVMWNPLMLIIVLGFLSAEWIIRKLTNLS